VGDAQELQPPARPAAAPRAAVPPAAGQYAHPNGYPNNATGKNDLTYEQALRQPPAAPAQREITSDAAELASAYAAAFEATAAADQYAKAAGVRDLRFSDKETITRLAMTVFIARSKNAGHS
jgi:pyruvate/2-oxoglutarate dehydrogenase complex dihydrolipoamide acyltransferase (E2) component